MVFDPNVFVITTEWNPLASVSKLLPDHGFSTVSCSAIGEILQSNANSRPGCVVTDFRMPEIHGEQLQQELCQRNSPLSVVFVTSHADIPVTVRLMRRGAIAVLEQHQLDLEALIASVELGLQISMRRHKRMQFAMEAQRRVDALTEDESQVMRGMISGKPIKLLARELGASMRTIDRRRSSVLRKMGVHSIGEMASMLAQQNILLENQAVSFASDLATPGRRQTTKASPSG